MSFKSHHYALLATLQRALTLPERYRARVLASGGTIYSMAAVEEAYAKAADWGVPADATHWSSPRFGNRVDNGQLVTRFCLFGNDVGPSAANNNWQLQPGPAGKPPQHYTGRVSMQFAGLPYTSLDLSAHLIFQPKSWEQEAYPYFPLLECSANPGPGGFNGFLVGAESSFMEGGYSGPNGSSVARLSGYSPVNTLATIALKVDTTLQLPDRRRVWVNGVQAPEQVNSGQIDFTAYDQATHFLGVRGLATQYAFNGNINDVFVTNKALSEAALAYLNNQKTVY